MAATSWMCGYPNRVWIAEEKVTMSRNTITKLAGDTVLLSFDFGDMPEIIAGATVAVITSIEVCPIDPTLPVLVSQKTIVRGYKVQGLYTGGAAGTDYTVTCSVVLSDNSVLVRTGTLKVV